MTPWLALITGLTTGGLTCMAVQGGLLLGVLAKRDGETTPPGTTWSRLVVPVSAFLIAKITIYTLLGLALGLIGAKLKLSTAFSVWLQSIAGAFIIITGLRIIWPHWLPWLTIAPPAGVRRYLRRQGKSESWYAPAFLGLLTILIPCGTTIAMETAAVATGNPWQAAMILFAFTLGTAPLFFIFGLLAKSMAAVQRKLAWVTAMIVLALGLSTVNGALVMVDSPYSFQNELAAARAVFGSEEATSAAVTNVTINVLADGYEPNAITIPTGTPVQLALKAAPRLGCTSIFRIPKLDVEEALIAGQTTTVSITAPAPGRYTFSCGMGMYTGTIEAV
ncbi:MAG: sulfite exporter TauE/SafE family protein [Candidatus Kerfeldbacteria bacterium]|nr:sulfite exporter TauE/SafE family protein [Candidatus Kerfeldbacteria bacterium]